MLAKKVLYSSAKRTAGADGSGLGAAADEDGEVRATEAGRVVQAVVRAVELDAVVAELAVDDLELFREAGDALLRGPELEPVGVVLAFHPAGADAEGHPAA